MADLTDAQRAMMARVLGHGFRNGFVLRNGSRGTTVRALQLFLKDQGFDISADGVFGPQTKDALQQFQSTAKVNSDGVAGSKTLNAIQSAIASAPAPAAVAPASVTPTASSEPSPLLSPADLVRASVPRPNLRPPAEALGSGMNAGASLASPPMPNRPPPPDVLGTGMFAGSAPPIPTMRPQPGQTAQASYNPDLLGSGMNAGGMPMPNLRPPPDVLGTGQAYPGGVPMPNIRPNMMTAALPGMPAPAPRTNFAIGPQGTAPRDSLASALAGPPADMPQAPSPMPPPAPEAAPEPPAPAPVAAAPQADPVQQIAGDVAWFQNRLKAAGADPATIQQKTTTFRQLATLHAMNGANAAPATPVPPEPLQFAQRIAQDRSGNPDMTFAPGTTADMVNRLGMTQGARSAETMQRYLTPADQGGMGMIPMPQNGPIMGAPPAPITGGQGVMAGPRPPAPQLAPQVATGPQQPVSPQGFVPTPTNPGVGLPGIPPAADFPGAIANTAGAIGNAIGGFFGGGQAAAQPAPAQTGGRFWGGAPSQTDITGHPPSVLDKAAAQERLRLQLLQSMLQQAPAQ